MLGFQPNTGVNQDAATTVPNPQMTWDSSGNRTPNYLYGTAPAAYVRSTNPSLELRLYNITGNATMGFTLDMQASPNTADPSLLLYETGSTPKTCGPDTFFNAQASLYNYVAYYNCAIRDLSFYVQFTKTGVPAAQAPWQMVSSYASSNNVISNVLYGLLATPTAPMSPAWTGVLDHACMWAANTSDATSATTALTTGFYNNSHYDYNNNYDTLPSTTPETFYLTDFLYGSTLYTKDKAMWGACNDFSDFMVCLSNAIGAEPLKSMQGVPYWDNGLPPPQPDYFSCNPVSLAPNTSLASPTPRFSYHQWGFDATAGVNKVFDGAMRFGGTTTPANLDLTTYITDLVANDGSHTTCQPLQPFVPIIQSRRP